MPRYVPIQDMETQADLNDTDYVPVSDGETSFAVQAAKFKAYSTDRAEAAAEAAEAAQEAAEAAAEDIESLKSTFNSHIKNVSWRNYVLAKKSVNTAVKNFKFVPDNNAVLSANIYVAGKNLLRNTAEKNITEYGVTWKISRQSYVIATGTPTGYTHASVGKFHAIRNVPYTIVCADGTKNRNKHILFEVAGTVYRNGTVVEGVPFIPTETEDLNVEIKREVNGNPISINAQVMVIVGNDNYPDPAEYVGEDSIAYNVSTGLLAKQLDFYTGDSTIVSDTPGKLSVEYYALPYETHNRNFLLSFITPSYSDGSSEQAYFPNDYALAVSYDGKCFCEINKTQYACRDVTVGADQFKGGNDTFVIKHNGYYICIAQNYNSATEAFADYVVTTDFLNYTPVKHFNGFNIREYILNEYSHSITDNRVWEPSLFHDLRGNLYIMASAQYKPDEQYPFDTAVTNKFFVQVYGQVQFNEQTLELQAIGSLNSFQFPDGVDTVIDVSIVPRSNDYLYCYKDETKLRSHVATLSSLESKPTNTLMNNLLGRDQIENPYIIDYGAFHLVFVTSYSPLLGQAQYVINGYGFGRAKAQICTVISPLIEQADGRKCRSLHPIVIDDEDIIDNINQLGHVIAPDANDYRASGTYTTLRNTFGFYYGLYTQLESARTYRIVDDITINLSNKWEDDTQPLRFITDGNSHTLVINGVSKTLPADNSVTMFDRLTGRFIN